MLKALFWILRECVNLDKGELKLKKYSGKYYLFNYSQKKKMLMKRWSGEVDEGDWYPHKYIALLFGIQF